VWKGLVFYGDPIMERDKYIVPQMELLEEYLLCQIMQSSDEDIDSDGERNPYYPGEDFDW
jgi:hypothetical protein